jgi:hypothetical protein
MSIGRSKRSGTPESVRSAHTISKHYYGDSCPGHHLEFIDLIEPKFFEDTEKERTRAQKLRMAETYPDTVVGRIGKVYREKVEAFERVNEETWDPEEEGP